MSEGKITKETVSKSLQSSNLSKISSSNKDQIFVKNRVSTTGLFRKRACPNSPEPVVNLNFCHRKSDMETPKETLRAMWATIDENNKPNGTLSDKSDTATSSSTTRTDDPTLSGMLSDLEMTNQDKDPFSGYLLSIMMAKGVDRAALAIRPNYPLKPKVCLCTDVCCSCFMYSPYIDQLKLVELRERLVKAGRLKAWDIVFEDEEPDVSFRIRTRRQLIPNKKKAF